MRYLVLGMHRSGTSAVTGVLERMGCFVSDEAERMPAREDNPKGFGERLDVAQLNDEILAAAGAAWHIPTALDLDRIPEGKAESFRERAASIVETLESRRPWVLKDPRIGLLLSFWKPMLGETVDVVVHRHPVQVAQSLQARDALPLPVGVTLWEVYNVAILRHTRSSRRFFVSFERLVKDPVSVSREIHEAAGRHDDHGLESPDPDAIREFIDADLFHHDGGDGVLEERYLAASQRALLDLLTRGDVPEGDEAPSISAESSRILEVHAEEYRERERQVARAIEAKGEEVQTLRSILKKRDEEIDSLRSTLEKKEEELENLRSIFDDKDEFIDSLQAALEEKERHLLDLRQSVEEHVEDLSSMQTKLEARDRTIASNRARLQALEDEVTALQVTLAEQETVLDDLDQTLLGRLARWRQRRRRERDDPGEAGSDPG